MGGYVSFSGILTFPKSTELRDIARDVPPDRLLVETDAPYLAPVPFRGKRNEPAWVAHTARVLAEVRGLAPAALADLTTANFRRLFRKAACMKVTLLGTGGSAGVPMIGGADGSGDWGVCDPAEPRNRRTRAVHRDRSSDEQRLLVDTGPDMRSPAAGLPHPRRGRHPVHPRPCRPHHRPGRRAHPQPHRRPSAGCLRHRSDLGRTGPALRLRLPALGAARTSIAPCLKQIRSSPATPSRPRACRSALFDQNHGRVDTLGLRIGGFGYSTDVVQLDDAAFEALAGVDTWVVDCFLRTEPIGRMPIWRPC